jgi:hypothetical protein
LTALGALGALALASGCVERLLEVRSEPPGAQLTFNGAPVFVTVEGERRRAVTPVEIPFDFYGTVEVGLVREGYLSTQSEVELRAPFYDYPPLDLVLEHLLPWTVVDRHRLELRLEPSPAHDSEQSAAMLRRVDELRRSLAGRAAPEPAEREERQLRP